MSAAHRSIVTWVMLVAGILLFLGGIGGFCSLYIASRDYERTTGTVQWVHTKKVYRHRKFWYESDMRLSYPTAGYGEMLASVKSYNPFRSKGDELTVWYHPERPRDIRLPGSECGIWGLLVVSGLICICGGFPLRS